MDTTHLSGALKVAVLIHSMGEKVSKDILSRMGEAEKKIVQQNMSQIGSISQEVLDKITQEFALLAEKINKLRQSGKQVQASLSAAEASRRFRTSQNRSLKHSMRRPV